VLVVALPRVRSSPGRLERMSLPVMLVPTRHTIFIVAVALEPFDGAKNHGRRKDCDNDE
jgi:hypothetical protein